MRDYSYYQELAENSHQQEEAAVDTEGAESIANDPVVDPAVVDVEAPSPHSETLQEQRSSGATELESIGCLSEEQKQEERVITTERKFAIRWWVWFLLASSLIVLIVAAVAATATAALLFSRFPKKPTVAAVDFALPMSKDLSTTDGQLSREVDRVLSETASRQTQAMLAQYKKPYPGPEVGMWHYSDLALASYWLNQTTELGDATFQQVIDKGLYRDKVQAGGFHWLAYQFERMYFLFSSNSIIPEFQGRMGRDGEENLLEMLWNWSYPILNTTWASRGIGYVWGSENHHAQLYVSLWGAAHVFKGHTDYKDRTFRDGSTPMQMAMAFDTYFKEYVRVYTYRGLAMEAASPTYAKYLLNTWYNLYDFAEDAELKAAASNLLNVYWANYAIESNDGVRGGSRHRSYPNAAMQGGGPSSHVWYIFGKGTMSKHPGAMSAATTLWRPARVVVALALDDQGRGSYEYKSRRLGLLLSATDKDVIDLNGGGLLRYSWCTPDFVMGVSQVEARPYSDWRGISSQNHWNGVIFAGHDTARIFTQRPKPAKGSVYNAEWGVQHKGAMILQRLTLSKAAHGQMIWFDASLNHADFGGWIFGTAPSAFAAVKIVRGAWTWRDSDDRNLGQWAILEDQFSPIIVEVARRVDYESMESFQAEILSNPVVWDGPKLEYTSTGYDNATLTLFTDESSSPQVDGVPIDFTPAKVYDSPYLEGKFGSGPVTIQYRDFKSVRA